jgi:hypothetical protein
MVDGMVEDENDTVSRLEPWLPRGLLQRGGSPDRRVESLREVLANLQATPSSNARSGMAIVMVLWPRRSGV